MKLGKIKTARLLITRLAVQVRLGEPKESKPLREIAKAFFVLFQQVPHPKRSSGTRQPLIGIFTPAPHQPPHALHRNTNTAVPTQKKPSLIFSKKDQGRLPSLQAAPEEVLPSRI
ncbi:hypothetical protein [Desulfovibrio desulfuricans]|uniref:hypothetical protein n=1 Tax=Desulfovibrio desulfuricans TaxID=876 RepID=UPI001C01AA4B|nr:hypothetical protein [Desulfovibrio desulfuricans]MBT9748538.1 hypothetical protein [Desulfovibrio desulfuricans]